MLIVLTNEMLELIKEFGIGKLNLMIVYDNDGVLEPIHNEFVLLNTQQFGCHLIGILVVDPLLNVHDHSVENSYHCRQEVQSPRHLVGFIYHLFNASYSAQYCKRLKGH